MFKEHVFGQEYLGIIFVSQKILNIYVSEILKFYKLQLSHSSLISRLRYLPDLSKFQIWNKVLSIHQYI